MKLKTCALRTITAVTLVGAAMTLKAVETRDKLCVSDATGDGVAQDRAAAAKWLRKAAEQGDAKAQCALGVCYVAGDGVAQDRAEAAKWYRKAAEQGDAQAQYNLGLCYAAGEGVARDKVEAVRWYRKAAEQGDADAKYALRNARRIIALDGAFFLIWLFVGVCLLEGLLLPGAGKKKEGRIKSLLGFIVGSCVLLGNRIRERGVEMSIKELVKELVGLFEEMVELVKELGAFQSIILLSVFVFVLIAFLFWRRYRQGRKQETNADDLDGAGHNMRHKT